MKDKKVFLKEIFEELITRLIDAEITILEESSFSDTDEKEDQLREEMKELRKNFLRALEEI